MIGAHLKLSRQAVRKGEATSAADFPTSLGELYWPVLEELLRSTLPLIFDGVETLPGDPGEILHDMHRDILE